MEFKMATKESLLGKDLKELREVARGLGMPGYIGDQLGEWLYHTRVGSIREMTNISKKNQALLEELVETGFTPPLKVQESADGTKKFLFRTLGGKFIETAYMPEANRNTLCVSTQAGCKMGCLFCMTGKQGFQANLTAGEILNQLRSLPEGHAVTNLVLMGMGEPFDNLEPVMKSLEILTSKAGFGISPRKITVSTIGIIPGIIEFLKNSQCNLAISLHSPFDTERRHLMPVQHVYPIQDVVSAIQQYNISKYRKISFEYILFAGLNDSSRHVKEIARLLNKIRCRINLMQFHPVPDAPLEGSDSAGILRFQQGLKDKGMMATIRKSRGLDIDAACGLLSTNTLISGNTERF